MELIERFAEDPWVCIVLTAFFYLLNYGDVYLLLGGLLRMHRSKTAVKKLCKQYKLSCRLWLKHFEEHCLHAIRFNRWLIWYLRINMGLAAVYLLLAAGCGFGLVSNMVLAGASFGLAMFFLVPIMVFGCLFSRPIIGRFKEYSFEKYHNTDDHSSLL